jgi:hypothetical protein
MSIYPYSSTSGLVFSIYPGVNWKLLSGGFLNRGVTSASEGDSAMNIYSSTTGASNAWGDAPRLSFSWVATGISASACIGLSSGGSFYMGKGTTWYGVMLSGASSRKIKHNI